jgi:[protein-PII] uridylyltransferase
MNDPYRNASEILKQKRKHLFSSFERMPPDVFLKQHAGILDDYFRESFEKSMIGPALELYKNPYAIIALGGYGREEQCLHSDVDLLFLFRKEVPQQAENLIQEIIYPLWDIGLEVGYATRALKECIHLARKDYEILTPILDARFVCGMSILFTELTAALRQKILKKQSKRVIEWLVKRNKERHRYFGDSTYLLEPNIKEGKGGLRDYHTMLWIGRIKLNLKQPRDLEYFGYLSHEEYTAVQDALFFIWNVRNRLHHKTDRKCDQLYFENQIKLAASMKFTQVNGQQPVERFLGELHGKMDFMKQQHLMFLREHGHEKKIRFHRTGGPRFAALKGLAISQDALAFVSSEAILHSPELLIKIFEESARLKIPLSTEAKRMINEFSYLIDDRFRTSATVVTSFEHILKEPVPMFNVLREMLNTGFLIYFIPQMKGIVNRIQYDEYHIYPVDKHSLKTVQALKFFGDNENDSPCALCNQLWKGLKNKKLLLWAALLHDIGKGVPQKDHAATGARMAAEILHGFGYSTPEIDTVSFLIGEHLLLMNIATRRDIHDEETAISCARIIKKVSRLQMLYLLTVADATSTGPNAWSGWISALLRDLFLKILNILKKGELASQHALKTLERKKEIVLSAAMSAADKKRWEAFYQVLSPRYLLNRPASEIPADIRLYESIAEREFVWNITKNDAANTRTIKVCAKDRPGLFSKIAGTFTLNNLDILDAQIFTWRNNMALDIFTVKPPPDKFFEEERWALAERNLAAALSGDLDLVSALNDKTSAYKRIKPKASKRSHRIVVDNTSSSFFTIIEVFTYDFPGLLFAVTDALYQSGLDIWVAKISTKVDQVVDVFYVRDVDGQKIDAEQQVASVKEAILGRLPEIV